jgi:hypothetical protein
LSHVRHLFVTGLFVFACPTDGSAGSARVTQLELARTIDALAAIGPKPSGTDGARTAAAWLRNRFVEAGIADVHTETYRFPRDDVRSSSLAISGRAVAHDVLDGSGAGQATGRLVWVGQALDLRGIDLHGRIALVERHPLHHRSAQYARVAAAGAAAMIYVSSAPGDLRQVGSVRNGWEPMGTIPALTISGADGRWLHRALAVSELEARVRVEAVVTPATGANVVARIRGVGPGTVVVGAHYDSWFAGATDNGAGVAALVALASRRQGRSAPPVDLVFVGFDGEELALYGAYAFLRRHRGEDIRGVIDLETPAARGAALRGLAHSAGAMDAALRSAQLDRQYPGYLGVELVPRIFGGVIPTDVQGFYRLGFSVASTAVDAPYYHTSADTPDKVDLDRLADAVEGFDRAISDLVERGSGSSGAPWHIDAHTKEGEVVLTVRDERGTPQAGAMIDVSAFEGDFLLRGSRRAVTDPRGVAKVPVPSCQWMHVAASRDYPLAEAIVEP